MNNQTTFERDHAMTGLLVIFTALLISCQANPSFGQDYIIKHNGEFIRSKIVEINESRILYQSVGFDDKRVISIALTEVAVLQYKNGTNDILNVLDQNKKVSDFEILNNDAVVRLHKKGLPVAMITKKIKHSLTDFDLSSNGLIQLKECKISNEIIASMIEKSSPVETNPEKKTLAEEVFETGIYYKNTGNQKIFMAPSVCSQTRTGSGVAAAYTYGAVSTKTIAKLDGPTARMQINESKPEFYFHFEKGNSLNSAAYWFSPSSSPNEFTLIRLTPKKNGREFIIGSMNRWAGNEWGVEQKVKVAFLTEKISPGIYKVTPEQNLAPGEYCFMYAGIVNGQGTAGQKIFDFSIRP